MAQRNHVDAKYALHHGLLVQIVEYDVGDLAPLELDYHPHTVFI